MVVEYCDGEMKSTLPECPRLAGLLYHLHRQPRLAGVWRWHRCLNATGRPAILRGARRVAALA
jgi:hypothetical protein